MKTESEKIRERLERMHEEDRKEKEEKAKRMPTIKVGDSIFFKRDIEQWAEVVEIRNEKNWCGDLLKVYVVKAPLDGFSGHYIGRMNFASIDADDVFDVNKKK